MYTHALKKTLKIQFNNKNRFLITYIFLLCEQSNLPQLISSVNVINCLRKAAL